MCEHTIITVHVQRSEGKWMGLVLSFHYAVPRNWTQVLSLGLRHIYPLSHLKAVPLTFPLSLNSFFYLIVMTKKSYWSNL